MAEIEVPAQGPRNARIMIVGEAPGEEEVNRLQPFVGYSGLELTRMLGEAGIKREDCYVTNVCKVRPPKNEIERFFGNKSSGFSQILGRYPNEFVRKGLADLERDVREINPDLVLAFGNTALWACTGQLGITKWRGSILSGRSGISPHRDGLPTGELGPKVIPTYHPAAILRQWPWRYIAVQDIRRAKRELDERGRKVVLPEYRFEIRPSFERVVDRLSSLLQRCSVEPLWLAVDVETQRRKLDCIGIAWSKTEALCIPFIQMDTPADRRFYWSVDEQVEIYWMLKELLTHPNCKVIGQNFPYDMQYIAREMGFLPNLEWDTMTIHNSIFSTLPKSLDFQASLYCDFYQFWKEDAKDEEGYRLDDTSQWTYNCRDIVYTYEIREKQEILLDQLKFRSVKGETPQQRQMSLHLPILKAMLRGVRSSAEKKAEVYRDIDSSIKEHEEWLNYVVGHPINPRSSDQLRKFFYTDMGMRPIFNPKSKPSKKTGLRNPTCDEEALKTIARRSALLAPICEVINDIRSLGTYRNVADTPLDRDRRWRCSYIIPGTDTYRFASKGDAFGYGTNLQNISGGSRGDEEAMAEEIKRGKAISALQKPNMRKMMVPDPGYTIMEFDLPQADARVVAWDSNALKLKAIFKDPTKDLHTENARTVFGECKGKEDPRRYFAKEGVHATNYLVKARTLAATLKCSEAQAQHFIDTWFKANPEIPDWHTRIYNDIFTKKYVENIWGYRRYCFDRIEEEIKEAVAWIGQSTVAITTNMGLREVDRDLCTHGVDVLMQVHDSVVFQVWTKDGPDLCKKIMDRMIVEIPYDDPLRMIPDMKCSEVSWGECSKRPEWLQTNKVINVPHSITQTEGPVVRQAV